MSQKPHKKLSKPAIVAIILVGGLPILVVVGAFVFGFIHGILSAA